jgi:hypothetical protein
VHALNGQLMGFDFRNGPLRRKYDGVKWGLRRLEDLLFEQSLLADLAASSGDEPSTKRPRPDGDPAPEAEEAKAAAAVALVDEVEFAAMRARLEAVRGAPNGEER